MRLLNRRLLALSKPLEGVCSHPAIWIRQKGLSIVLRQTIITARKDH